MLLRFSVSNFRSIRDRQELSMIASKAIKDDDSGLIEAPALRGEKVLPAAVIYGANASGKSNFVKALAHLKFLVRDSHRRGEPGGPVPLRPFLLDADHTGKPSIFSLDFVVDGSRYAYSFEAIANEFVAESLHIWRGGPRSMLFERRDGKFDFGRSLKGENRTIERLTRPNSLFLSAASQNNHEQLTEVAEAIESMYIDTASALSPQAVLKERMGDFDRRALKFLSVADVGVSDARVVKKEKNREQIQFSERFVAFMANEIKSEDKNEILSALSAPELKIQLGHKARDAKTIFFDLDKESAGTIQLLSILQAVFVALDRGGLIVIDEFGSRTHTRVSELLIALFDSREINPKNAQLIVTTHDTNLLNTKGLRRDQVWFTEKDEEGVTHLYPLTDIETRKGDNLERGYLQGRYGAIPFAGSLSDFEKID